LLMPSGPRPVIDSATCSRPCSSGCRRPATSSTSPWPARSTWRGRGALLGLVASPRLELLQQGAARRLADPPVVRVVRAVLGARHGQPHLRRAPARRGVRHSAVDEPVRADDPGVRPAAPGVGTDCRGADAADRDGRLHADDHRRAVHVLLGLGDGVRVSAITKGGIAWELAGVCIGLGILAKYTMVVFVPSLVLYLLFQQGTPQAAVLWRLLEHAGAGGDLLSADPRLETPSTTGSRSSTSSAWPAGTEGAVVHARSQDPLETDRSSTSATQAAILLGFCSSPSCWR